MAKIKENKILKSVLAFLNIHGSREVDNLIKQKNEFSTDENFGLMWIIMRLMKSNQSSLLGSNDKEEMLVRQWLEYAFTHLCHLNNLVLNDVHLVLKELSEALSDRVFLTGTKLSLADLVFYYTIHSTISKLSLFEKEKYIHVSRWFDYLQRDQRIRQSNTFIIFSRNILYN